MIKCLTHKVSQLFNTWKNKCLKVLIELMINDKESYL